MAADTGVHKPRDTCVHTIRDLCVITLEDTGKSLVMDELGNLVEFTAL